MVRFIITQVSPREAHFEQAYSTDGGQSWEDNWIAVETRRGVEGGKVYRYHTASSPPLYCPDPKDPACVCVTLPVFASLRSPVPPLPPPVPTTPARHSR